MGIMLMSVHTTRATVEMYFEAILMHLEYQCTKGTLWDLLVSNKPYNNIQQIIHPMTNMKITLETILKIKYLLKRRIQSGSVNFLQFL